MAFCLFFFFALLNEITKYNFQFLMNIIKQLDKKKEITNKLQSTNLKS